MNKYDLEKLEESFEKHDRKTCGVSACIMCFIEAQQEHDKNLPCEKEICVFCKEPFKKD